MLTLNELKSMQPKAVFAHGVIENSPDGIYMTDCDKGRNLIWAAQRGSIHDWTIYCHWESSGLSYVLSNGDKVMAKNNIRKLVPCEDEAFSMYRF